jgi:4-cresol dehydrogenase (hydroxylating)
MVYMIPPGMTEADFSTALDRFAAVVGPEWLFSSEDDMDTYRDSYSPFWGAEDERLAAAAVAPANVDEVQEIVRIANEFKVPIYPISTGKNLGYGGSAPNLSGSVVVDLKRMNKIIEIDPVRNFAVVEPGVSYFDLYNYIQENNLPLWIDCPEPGWGSVLGNAVDRGLGYTHQKYRDHFGAHSGFEVVLPNGELMRTGMGALPGATTWQDYKYGFGPYLDGMFTQGNYGIVTKMGIQLMPQPEALSVLVVEGRKYSDIIPLVEVLNKLEAEGICDGLSQISSPVSGPFGTPQNADLTKTLAKPGGPTDDEIEALSGDKNFWAIRLLCYGPKAVAAAKLEHARAKFLKALPTAEFPFETQYSIPLSPEESDKLDPITFHEDRKVNFGIPNLSTFLMGARSPVFPTPSDGHIWFSPVIERTGQGIMKAQNIFCGVFSQLPVYNGLNAPLPLCYYDRAFIMIFPVMLDKSDIDANRARLGYLQSLVQLSAANGWGEYRAAPALQDFIMDTYSFNDHAYRKLCETIKDAVDPNGIIAAGRYGIWPKDMREA